jgi:hypothetical protein
MAAEVVGVGVLGCVRGEACVGLGWSNSTTAVGLRHGPLRPEL